MIAILFTLAGIGFVCLVAAREFRPVDMSKYDPRDQHTYKITRPGPVGVGSLASYFTGTLKIGDNWNVTDIFPNDPNVEVIK